MIQIKPDRIRDIIGPGGKVIRAIQETTQTKIDVDDSGRVTIFSPDGDALEQAQQAHELVQHSEHFGKVVLKVR